MVRAPAKALVRAAVAAQCAGGAMAGAASFQGTTITSSEEEEGTRPWISAPEAETCVVTDIVGTMERSHRAGILGLSAQDTLNADPHNLRAEELALQECTLGIEVRRVWSETELVRSFGGKMSPGTPDGMFESWEGDLICVQVVRVPLTADADVCCQKEILAQTVLMKVVKSQLWLGFTHASPKDFIIFCWLPYAVPEEVIQHAFELMARIQRLDHRFSLRVRTPSDASLLFPVHFACNDRAFSKCLAYSETDVSTFKGSDTASDRDEEDVLPGWDIFGGFDEEEPTVESSTDSEEAVAASSEETMSSSGEGGASSPGVVDDVEDEVEFEWHITWDDGG